VLSSSNSGPQGGCGCCHRAFLLVLICLLSQGRHSFTWAPKSHRVYYGSIVDPGTGATIDEVILLTMLCPRSYTVEDVVEVQCHGGGVSARRVLGAAIGAGARPARPGEFTLRAFLNGRLDLSQVRGDARVGGGHSPSSRYCFTFRGVVARLGKGVLQRRGSTQRALQSVLFMLRR
jgi:hypothetical protein